MLVAEQSFDRREDGADLVGFAGGGDDPQGSRGRAVDLVGRFVGLEAVERLSFGDLRTVGSEPFGDGSFVHRKADLRQEHFNSHAANSPSVFNQRPRGRDDVGGLGGKSGF